MWIVTSVITGRELEVERFFIRAGLRSFCPRGFKLTKPTRKRSAVKVLVPAFPGYIFLDMDTVPGFQALEHIPHLIGAVRFGGEVVFLGGESVDYMKAAAARGEYDRKNGSSVEIRFAIGEHVVLRSGAFSGVKGVVTGNKGDTSFVELNTTTLTVNIKTCFLERRRV